MEIIVETIAANQTKTFRKAGGYMEIIDSSYAVGLNFYSDLGGQINSLKGGLSGLYLQADFGAFDVVNGAVSQTVTLLVCDKGEIGGSRRQPGNVRVIDSGADKTLAGNQFYGSCQVSATGGGSVAVLQAAGAGGKRVSVKRLGVSSGTAGAILVLHATSMGTLGSPTLSVPSKIINGTVSGTARIQAFNCVGSVPSVAEIPGSYGVARIYVPANTITSVPIDTPLIVSGSAVLGINAEALSRDLVVYFDLEEI